MTLSGCGLINAFIPDQKVVDPLGIDNKQVTLTAGPAPKTQALSLTVSSAFVAAFSDIDTSGFPAGIQPNAVMMDLALKSTATLTSTTGALPNTIDVTAATLSLTLKDGSGAPSVTIPATATGSLLKLTKQDTSCVAALGCDYDVALASGRDTLLTVKASGPDFATLWAIATAGDEPNTVQGEFSLTLEPSVPQDVQVQVTISAPEGTFSF